MHREVKQMCRACMCKNQTFHSLFDGAADKPLTFYEMFSSTISQVPIHHNDELPKKICTSCVKSLIAVYDFHQMCMVSDVYMRSQLVKKEPFNVWSDSEQKLPVMAKESEQQDSSPVTSCPIKVETHDEEFIVGYQDGDTDSSKWRNCGDIGSLSKSGYHKVIPTVTRELQGCLKFEVGEIEVQESEWNTCSNTKNNFSRDKHNNANDIKLESVISGDSEENEVTAKEEEEEVFVQTNNLKTHLRHTTDKPHKCLHCQKAFINKSALKTHIRVHSAERPYKCNVCNKKFSSISNMKKHQITHTKDKPHKCLHCQKAFINKSALKTHMRVHTGERPYKCNVCNQRFSEFSNMKRHQLTHTGEKPFKCDECGKTFGLFGNLKQHRRTHNRDDLYKCSICEKAFLSKNDLKMHISRHTGERHHECDECNKAFITIDNLKQHQRTHTGEKPFKCEHCEKSFASRSNLSKHVRTHTGDRPHKCDECNKTFSEFANLKSHQRTHTGDRPYECNFCKKAFGSNYGLKRHLWSCDRQ